MRIYDLYFNLKTKKKIRDKDKPFWMKVLSVAVDDPQSLIEEGIDSFTDDAIDSDVNFLGIPNGETEFTWQLTTQLSGGYGLDKYLEDVEKAIYLSTKHLNTKFDLQYSATDLDRPPDECGRITSGELAAKYGMIA
jgi:hypothetical protein